MLIKKHLRFAAGVCVLSTGFLIGSAGGAIAVADTATSGSTGGGQSASKSASAPTQGVSPASGPLGSVADTLRISVQKTIQGITSTLGSLGKPGQQHSTVAGPPNAVPEATATESESNGSGLSPAVPSPVSSDPGPVAPVTNVVASVPGPVAPVTNVVASVPGPVAPVTNVVASVPGPVAPVTNVVASVPNVLPSVTVPVAPVSKVVATVTDVVGSVGNAVVSVPAVVASLPSSTTPVSDVITSVQQLLTWAADAVARLTQLPSDLFSLLGVAGVGPAENAGGLSTAASAPLLARQASRLPQVLRISGIRGVPMAGNVAGVATLGGITTTSLSQESALSGLPSLAPHGVIPTGAPPSFLERTVSELLVPASLSALAAVALPGVGGLLIICAAGVRIGYRQAKAGLALRTAGIARFAGPGPLGVVHSGSLVALRPRALRVVSPEALRASRLLDQVA
jgi:hypothetical protein